MAPAPIYLPLPEYFSYAQCYDFLAFRRADCMYVLEEDTRSILKVLFVEGQDIIFRISASGSDALRMDIISPDAIAETQAKAINTYVSDWFDLSRNLCPFYDLLENSPHFSYMVDAFYGLRLVGIPDLYEGLCWCIIGQQINLAFAYRLKQRFVALYGRSIIFGEHVLWIHPQPERVAEIDPEELRPAQFSGRKAEYIKTISEAFASGSLSVDKLLALDTLPMRQKLLMSFRGIGLWTANYALMKSLKVPNTIPYGDAGLNQSLKRHELSLEEAYAGFAGWESYLTLYLWKSKE